MSVVYSTFHLIGGVDSDGRVYFRVDYEGKILTFTEMYELHDWRLVTVIPINIDEEKWRGVAIFEKNIEN